jgi:hypothetical protein
MSQRLAATGDSRSSQLASIGVIFGVDREHGTMFVQKLVPGGSAESTGSIAVGDLLLQVDGVDVTRKPASHVCMMCLGEAGTQVKLVLQRPAASAAGRSKTLVVQLEREILPPSLGPQESAVPPVHPVGIHTTFRSDVSGGGCSSSLDALGAVPADSRPPDTALPRLQPEGARLGPEEHLSSIHSHPISLQRISSSLPSSHPQMISSHPILSRSRRPAFFSAPSAANYTSPHHGTHTPFPPLPHAMPALSGVPAARTQCTNAEANGNSVTAVIAAPGTAVTADARTQCTNLKADGQRGFGVTRQVAMKGAVSQGYLYLTPKSNRKPQTLKPQTPNPTPHTHPKNETRHPTSSTGFEIPRPQTRNPKPETRNSERDGRGTKGT